MIWLSASGEGAPSDDRGGESTECPFVVWDSKNRFINSVLVSLKIAFECALLVDDLNVVATAAAFVVGVFDLKASSWTNSWVVLTLLACLLAELIFSSRSL